MSAVRRDPLFREALKSRAIRTRLLPKLVRKQLETKDLPQEEIPPILNFCANIANKAEEGKEKKQQLIFTCSEEVVELVERILLFREKSPERYRKFFNSRLQFEEAVSEELESRNLGKKDKTLLKNLKKVSWDLVQKPERLEVFGDVQLPPFEKGYPTEEVAKALVGLFVDNCSDTEKCESLLTANSSSISSDLSNKEKEAIKKELCTPLSGMCSEIILLGRMTTSPAFPDTLGCVSKADSISTNQMTCEVDFFSAMDDLLDDGASAHIGERAFTSNCYYEYTSVAWSDFEKQNIARFNDAIAESHPSILKALLTALVRTQSVGMQSSKASKTLPSSVLIEVRPNARCVSYHDAFLTPAVAGDNSSWVDDSVNKLKHYVHQANRIGNDAKRFWFDLENRPLAEGAKEYDGFETFSELLEAVLSEVQR